MARKKNYGVHKGKDIGSEHYSTNIRSTMEEPAWRALSSTAQALYAWLKLEWKGPKFNNNGKLSLSYKQAADRMGIASPDTIAKAYQDLQAKGFIVITETACLGLYGYGKSFRFEITELSMPNSDKNIGRQLYKKWQPGNDFDVVKARANNPTGKNKNPS